MPGFCPICDRVLTKERWRTGDLISGYVVRCECGDYSSATHKDGRSKKITIVTVMALKDDIQFREGHVPGPEDVQ